MVATLISDSVEDAAGALPSAIVQMALTDTTWQSGPLMNFLDGGGMAMLQAVLMGRGMPAGRGSAGPAPDPRAAALALALPAGLREGSFVTPDPDLPGRTVRVEPLRIGNRIVGVDIRVGPGATPLDIALHAPTVHAMQKYRGVLGDVRRILEDTAARLTGSGLTVGSRGWEARIFRPRLMYHSCSR